MPDPQSNLGIFVCYSHADEVWLKRLHVHLAPLARDPDLVVWSDRSIKAGENWQEEIRNAIDSAAVAVLLVSADFLASEFISRYELPPLLASAESCGLLIIPIVLRACLFSRTPELSRFQSVNDPTAPLVGLSESEIDATFAAVAERIKDVLQPPEPKTRKRHREGDARSPELPMRAEQPSFVPMGLVQETRSGDLFQNFIIERPGGNINPVSRLWADVVEANSISASINQEEGFSEDQTTWFLRVKFSNKAKSYPGNLTVRPQEEQALAHDFRNPLLTFKARIPQATGAEAGLLEEIAVGIRVINMWDQHWEYSDNPNEYVQLRVRGTDWHQYSVDLMSHCWHLFRGDGNVHGGPINPDFGVLCGVIFELGSANIPGRPGGGVGVIDITQIKLKENLRRTEHSA